MGFNDCGLSHRVSINYNLYHTSHSHHLVNGAVSGPGKPPTTTYCRINKVVLNVDISSQHNLGITLPELES